jgi:hypothetical protein
METISNDVEPYVLRSITEVDKACTRWLNKRGLITMSMRETLQRSCHVANWKKERRVQKAFSDSCRVWDRED